MKLNKYNFDRIYERVTINKNFTAEMTGTSAM